MDDDDEHGDEGRIAYDVERFQLLGRCIFHMSIISLPFIDGDTAILVNMILT